MSSVVGGAVLFTTHHQLPATGGLQPPSAVFILVFFRAPTRRRSPAVSGMRQLEPLSPQREAAFFYALFLRGHHPEKLRRDIDVPPEVLAKWLRCRDFEPPFRQALQQIYDYRKQVLAIFDSLISTQNTFSRPQ